MLEYNSQLLATKILRANIASVRSQCSLSFRLLQHLNIFVFIFPLNIYYLFIFIFVFFCQFVVASWCWFFFYYFLLISIRLLFIVNTIILYAHFIYHMILKLKCWWLSKTERFVETYTMYNVHKYKFCFFFIFLMIKMNEEKKQPHQLYRLLVSANRFDKKKGRKKMRFFLCLYKVLRWWFFGEKSSFHFQ